MTTPDEDLVRSMYTGFSSLASGGDVDEYVRAHYHQDIEYRAVEEIEPVRGHQALIDWTVRWFEAWEEFRADVIDVTAVGDALLVEISIGGRGVGSGAVVELGLFHVIQVREGRILRMSDHLERDDALATARSA